MQNEIFKSAVGKFPTGVTVVTANYDGKLWGVTANSFTSVSLEPKLISFCLNKQATSIKAFKLLTNFAVNILSTKQEDISRNFATSKKDKFENIDYSIGQFSEAPFLKGVISYIECKKYDQIDCGDHYIFIGEVINTVVDHTKSPLVYFAKSYYNISS